MMSGVGCCVKASRSEKLEPVSLAAGRLGTARLFPGFSCTAALHWLGLMMSLEDLVHAHTHTHTYTYRPATHACMHVATL